MQILFSKAICNDGVLTNSGIYKIINKVNGKWDGDCSSHNFTLVIFRNGKNQDC